MRFSVLLMVSYIVTLAVSIGVSEALNLPENAGFAIGSFFYLVFMCAKYDVKSMLLKKNTCPMKKLKKTYIYFVSATIGIFSIVGMLLFVLNQLGTSWMEIGQLLMRDRVYGWIWLIYAVVLGPIVEEILFRGIIFERLLLKHRTLYANIIQAFLFAVVHGSPEKWISPFVMGIFWGQVKVKSGTIRNTIFMHMFWNAFYNAFFLSVKCVLS